MEKCKHKFSSAAKDGGTASNGAHMGNYVIIFCENCGLVSFDQAKQGMGGDYQKRLLEESK
jgi:hypothetical protein